MYLTENINGLLKRPESSAKNELRQVEKRIKQLLAAEKLTGTRYYDEDIKRLMIRRKELQAGEAT